MREVRGANLEITTGRSIHQETSKPQQVRMVQEALARSTLPISETFPHTRPVIRTKRSNEQGEYSEDFTRTGSGKPWVNPETGRTESRTADEPTNPAFIRLGVGTGSRVGNYRRGSQTVMAGRGARFAQGLIKMSQSILPWRGARPIEHLSAPRQDTEQTLIHEVGHHISATGRMHHAAYANEEQRGMEEAYADDISKMHWRPDPRDVKQGREMHVDTGYEPRAGALVRGEKVSRDVKDTMGNPMQVTPEFGRSYIEARKTLTHEERRNLLETGSKSVRRKANGFVEPVEERKTLPAFTRAQPVIKQPTAKDTLRTMSRAMLDIENAKLFHRTHEEPKGAAQVWVPNIEHHSPELFNDRREG
jgi:hypothetical protein